MLQVYLRVSRNIYQPDAVRSRGRGRGAKPRKGGQVHLKRIRNYFVTGLIVLFPVIITWEVLVWLFHIVDGLLAGLVTQLFGHPVPGVGLGFTALTVFFVGLLATNLFGRRLIDYGETLMRRVPIVRSIYITMKQITDAFVRQEQAAFSRVCLVEYPRKGIYSLGFLTSPASRDIQKRVRGRLVGVFVPTTPNPTSGFLLYVPETDVVYLEMPVQDGLKLVISGGVAVPDEARPPERRSTAATEPKASGGEGGGGR